MTPWARRIPPLLTLLLWLAATAVLTPAGALGQQSGGSIDVEADRLIGSRGPNGEEILLEGNVVLRKGTSIIRSARGRWVTGQRAVYLTGGVVANDGTLEITADQADYFETSELILLSGNVHVVDDGLDATSEFGSYNARSRTGELWGEVTAVELDRTIRARQIRYERDTGRAVAQGNVWVSDSTGSTILVAQYVDYSRNANVALARGEPRLTRIENGKKTVLTADTLYLDSNTNISTASGNVRLERDTLTATADYAIYWEKEARGILLGSPRVWNREVEATGDSILYYTEDGEINLASVQGNADIRFEGQSTGAAGEQNRLEASAIDVFFVDGRVESLYAVYGAVNTYSGAPRPGFIPEENEIRGEQIYIYFKESALDRAVVTGTPKGRYTFEATQADSARRLEEVVHYDGERVVYEIKRRNIQINGSAHILYQGMDLKAGRVNFDSVEGTLVARDNPTLKNLDQEELKGRTMTYDLETRAGTVYQATTEYDRGYYSGRAIHDPGDNTLFVSGARYTTCSLEHPHYAVYSNTMKVKLRDKIIARPVVFRIKNVPVFALPFYLLPVDNDRHSGIIFPQFSFGFNSTGGRFIRNLGYYWAANDYMDLTLAGDYYQFQPHWIGRFEGRYRVLGKVDGSITTRFTSGTQFSGNQWELRAFHNQTVSRNTRLTAQANFTSSREFQRSSLTGESLETRLNRFLTSTVNINHRRGWGSLNFGLSRREDLDANPITSPLPKLTQNLPQLSISIPQRPIGRVGGTSSDPFLPFLSTTYYNLNIVAVNRTQSFVQIDLPDSTDAFRAGELNLNLSDNRRLPVAGITMTPRFSTTAVLYEEDELGQSFQPAAVYGLGLSASTTYFGSFRTNILGLKGIRHIIFPQIGYNWQPEFESLSFVDTLGITRSRFRQVSGIGISANKQSFMNYTLQQRFQLRYRRGEEVATVPNFLTWTTNGSYDFLWRENGRATPWLPMTNRFNIQPQAYFSLSATTLHSFHAKPYLRSFSFSGQLRLAGGAGRPGPIADIPLDGNEALSRPDALTGRPWSLNFSYSYTGGRDGLNNWTTAQTANSVLSIKPTTNWHLDYYNTINLTEGTITAQEFAVVRDLHCWQARFVRRFTATGESEFYIRFNLKDRGDVYFEQGSRGLGTPVNF